MMSLLDLAPVRKARVADGVAEQIERLITQERLRPGDKLPPERDLAERLNVSRASVREAMQALELIGLVERRQGEGTVVSDLSTGSLSSPLATLLDARKMLEPPLAARAALRASPAEVAYLEDILRRQEEKARHGEIAVEEDSEFHYAIATAARNNVILKVIDLLMDLLRESRSRSLQVEARRHRSLAGHRRILNAIKRRDSAAAERGMRRHIEEIEKIILEKR